MYRVSVSVSITPKGNRTGLLGKSKWREKTAERVTQAYAKSVFAVGHPETAIGWIATNRPASAASILDPDLSQESGHRQFE